jgi:ribose/xylose/arabinose/galactoside ABC-type transport system permease subunit
MKRITEPLPGISEATAVNGASEPANAGATATTPRSSRLRRLFGSREMVILGVFLLELLAFALVDARHPGQTHFVSLEPLLGAARGVSLIGIAAVGASMVIISGGIDLSPGAVYGLSGVVFVLLLTGHVPPPLALLGGVGAGLSFGLFNGAAIAWLKIPPFIVTLGTLGIAGGLAFLLTNGELLPSADHPMPDQAGRFLDALDTHFFRHPGFIGINVGFVVMLLLAIWFTFWLQATRSGRYIVAIGGNEEAARYAGVRVEANKTLTYALAGILASLSGIFYVARYGGINSGVGPGEELNIIAASVVGGVSLTGGKGSPLGAIIGALIIKVLNDGLIFNEVPQAGAKIAVGVFIIAAVMVDRLLQGIGERAGLKQRRT